MVDPIVDASTLDFITTIVDNSDQLAEEYERFFGKPIELTEENAGYQLLRGILDNGVRLYSGHRDVGDLVGDTSMAEPPIGIGMVYSQMRYYGDESRGDLRHQPFLELKPAVGMIYPSLQNIAYKAPNPNAAKLMIKYLNGDDQGGLGLAPWFQEGNWPARQDITVGHAHPVLGEINWKLEEINFWVMDPEAIWEQSNDVQDWWMVNAY
jgi:iron(III) transport system substrate-binding protein